MTTVMRYRRLNASGLCAAVVTARTTTNVGVSPASAGGTAPALTQSRSRSSRRRRFDGPPLWSPRPSSSSASSSRRRIAIVKSISSSSESDSASIAGLWHQGWVGPQQRGEGGVRVVVCDSKKRHRGSPSPGHNPPPHGQAPPPRATDSKPA